MNLTYLFGAGASYNALPVVNGIPETLENFASQFNPGERYHSIAPIELWGDKTNIALKILYQFNYNPDEQKEYFEKLEHFYKDILWLQSEAKNHTSIDTFAKKLYLQNDLKNLKKLKTLLSCFFLYLQTKNFDNRYDSFFASILNDLTSLPENLKLLSWNYDSQIEIGFNNFANGSMQEAKKKLNLHSKGDIMYDAYSPNEFCVYKINGTTNVQKGDFNVESILNNFKSDDLSMVNSFLELHEELSSSKSNPNMTFAWEDFNTEKGFFPNLSRSVSETEILVVIGYSFPFFNRKVDKFILDSMSKLKKIYVQDPHNAKDIIEKIKGLIPLKTHDVNGYQEPINYEEKTYSDQFFIPIEF